MGAEHKKLGVPGEEELSGRGISYCATCDAAFFKDRPIIVVGGGDSAMEEAIFLAKFGSKVSVVHRRDEFRASKIMLERAQVDREHRAADAVRRRGVPPPGEGHDLAFARLRNTETGEERVLEGTGGVHRDRPRAAVGDRPGPRRHRRRGLRDDGAPSTRTNRPGVFAAGDLVDHTYRQAVTAAGSGCQAALDAEWYLRDTPEVHPAPPAARGRSGRGAVRADGQALGPWRRSSAAT